MSFLSTGDVCPLSFSSRLSPIARLLAQPGYWMFGGNVSRPVALT
jgi:hypothetical protein